MFPRAFLKSLPPARSLQIRARACRHKNRLQTCPNSKFSHTHSSVNRTVMVVPADTFLFGLFCGAPCGLSMTKSSIILLPTVMAWCMAAACGVDCCEGGGAGGYHLWLSAELPLSGPITQSPHQHLPAVRPSPAGFGKAGV